jgi:hypothetical protein
LKPLVIRKSVRHSYHALGVCLSPKAPLRAYKHVKDTHYLQSQEVAQDTPLP